MKRIYLALVALTLTLSATAAEERPGFLHPEVIKAAVAIDMNDEQAEQFRTSVGAFIDGRVKAFRKLARGHNQTGIERKMKLRTRKLLKTMDEEMAAFLSEAQMPAYEHYRDTLVAHMQ